MSFPPAKVINQRQGAANFKGDGFAAWARITFKLPFTPKNIHYTKREGEGEEREKRRDVHIYIFVCV